MDGPRETAVGPGEHQVDGPREADVGPGERWVDSPRADLNAGSAEEQELCQGLRAWG